jgi:mannose-6-phosphate isomerase-like protein (cupin superfamily)
MIPAIVTVKHRTLEEFGPMSEHRGEELILVLSGEIELHTEHYNPVRLSTGDSVYIDSTMPHAMLSVGKEIARILSVCTHEIPKERESRESDKRLAAPAQSSRALRAQASNTRGRTLNSR